mgnify:CR=1 FL=1
MITKNEISVVEGELNMHHDGRRRNKQDDSTGISVFLQIEQNWPAES